MKIICFLLLGSIAILAFPQGISASRSIIEEEDRKILGPFFRALLTHQELGYVLLGEKPAIRLGYVHHLSWKHPLLSLTSLHYFNKRNLSQKKAWEVWKKYSHQLSDQFLVVEETNSRSPLCADVFIIHRGAFCKVINENRELFEKILKREITGEALYEEAKRQPLFSVLLDKNVALLGIILGYGKVNSMLFAEKKMNELGLFPQKEDEIASIGLPIFRAKWDEPETIQLREKYLACRENIGKTFSGCNTFDQILRLLFAEDFSASLSEFPTKTTLLGE